MTTNFTWAVKEMKKGRFIRCTDWTPGLYHFMQCKDLIGNNENNRTFLINTQNNYKCFGGGYAILRYPSENVVYFLSDFEAKNWISKSFKQIKNEWERLKK